MKRSARLLGGALVGAALLVGASAISPVPASAVSDGFCDETENYVCCCTTNPDGSIQSCRCEKVENNTTP